MTNAATTWIPVSEALPPPLASVLVAVEGSDEPGIASYYPEWSDGDETFPASWMVSGWTCGDDPVITHWQPLPALP